MIRHRGHSSLATSCQAYGRLNVCTAAGTHVLSKKYIVGKSAARRLLHSLICEGIDIDIDIGTVMQEMCSRFTGA